MTGILVVSHRGCKLQILVSLRVFRTESQYFYRNRYRLGMTMNEKLKSMIMLLKSNYRTQQSLFVCFSMVSLRGQIKPEPRPDWSPLGVKFKFLNCTLQGLIKRRKKSIARRQRSSTSSN